MIKSLIKLALSPHRASFRPQPRQTPIVILGNGPGLTQTLAECRPALDALPLMAVNFAASTPEFASLRPEFYVLADPHFFNRTDDPNVCRLMDALQAVDWQMTLFVPFGAKPRLTNSRIRIERFPMNAIEGPARFQDALFGARLGMPRPRNVLIPALMTALWLGFKEIYLCGADHSWLSTLSVNERNEVISVQPHFYEEDPGELQRQRIDYLHIPLHSVLESQMIAFRSYHYIERYARRIGAHIYNSTPGSFIDAFPRKPLPEK